MARKAQENPQLDMTPMIDVVFELIIFFVINIKAKDILSRLNANRPAPNTSSSQEKEENDTSIKIDIGKPGYGFEGLVFKERAVSRTDLDNNIKQIAKTSKETTVIVRCTLDSPHGLLVYVLDTCSKYGLYNISIFSM